MSNRNTIVLERCLRIGDRVVMAMEQEARNWGRPCVPDGTHGTVIGFHRYERHVPRVGGFGKKPGVWRKRIGKVFMRRLPEHGGIPYTEERILQDEVQTMHRHIDWAEQHLDHAKGILAEL